MNAARPRKAEKRWVLIFAVVVMFLTTLPYLWGYQQQDAEWRYSGLIFGVDDGFSYLAKMGRGSVGDWLFRTPYTAKQQSGVFAFFPYLLIGKLARGEARHEQIVALFHGMRFLGGVFAIWAMYEFIAIFILDRALRRWGILLATLGGGLGWLFVIFGNQRWLGSLPLEYYSPETFGFLTLYGLPHLAFSRGFFFLGLKLYLQPEIIPRRFWMGKGNLWPYRGAIASGLCFLLAGIFQPLNVALAWMVISAHFVLQNLIEWARAKKNFHFSIPSIVTPLTVGLVSSPIVIYTLIAFQLDPIAKVWTSQNIIPSPHPFHYLLAFGVMLPFAVHGLIQVLKTRWREANLLAAWFLIFPGFVYFPYVLQRRLAEGFWVALVILVLLGMKTFSSRLRYLFLLVFPSTLFLWLSGLMGAENLALPVFRPADEIAVFDFLAEQTGGETIVLSSFNTGNALPAWAPVFVVIGHGPETAHLAEIQPRVEAFYQTGTSDESRTELLKAFNVDYVFWGPEERKYGDWNLTESDDLRLVFRQGAYQLFSVNFKGE